MTDFNKMAESIHQANCDRGWWPDDVPEDNLIIKLQLVFSEIAEATEAERKDLYDNHLPKRKGGEVELADALIRLLDLAGHTGWEHESHPEDFDYRLTFDASVLAMHAYISCNVAHIIESDDFNNQEYYYNQAVNSILRCGALLGYDILGAVEEKLQYNAVRPDHDPKNRAMKGGKKF